MVASFPLLPKTFFGPDLLMDSRSIVEMEMSDVYCGGVVRFEGAMRFSETDQPAVESRVSAELCDIFKLERQPRRLRAEFWA